MNRQQAGIALTFLGILAAAVMLWDNRRFNPVAMALQVVILAAMVAVRSMAGIHTPLRRYDKLTPRRGLVIVILAAAALYGGWRVMSVYSVSLAQATDFETR